jgi:hypothetical protein
VVVKPGVAFITDIAAHHAEVIFGGGTRTLAALSDLAEICQAAVLNDTLAVSPIAYRGSTLLQQLDCVETPDVDLVPAVDESAQGAATAEDIVIDQAEDGELTTDHPEGRLFLTYLAGSQLYASPVLWGLTHPEQLGPDRDRGLYFLDKLPAFVFLLQARKGAAAFESEDVRSDLLKRTQPHLTAYRKYASRVVGLQESHGVEPVFSCLEAPLGDDLRVNRAVESLQTPAFWSEFRGRLNQAVMGDRTSYFQKWKVPPLGLMVLGSAARLDDLPREIAKLRKPFLKIRRELIKLEEDRRAAYSDGVDDRRYREAVRVDQRIRKAYEAFDASLADHRRSREVKRAEWVFSMPKYIASLVSLGIGSVGDIIAFADLERRNYLGYVPGLHKAASFIKASDRRYIAEIAERFLGRPVDLFAMHRRMLQFAVDKVRSYSDFADGAAPVEADEFTIGAGEGRRVIPHSELWGAMVKEDELRQLLLHPIRTESEHRGA